MAKGFKMILLAVAALLMLWAQSALCEADSLPNRYNALLAQEEALTLSIDKDALAALAEAYRALGDYQDAPARARELLSRADAIVDVLYTQASLLTENKEFGEAITLLSTFGEYGNQRVTEHYLTIARKYLELNKMAEFSALFKRASRQPDAEENFLAPLYEKARSLLTSGAKLKAFQVFTLLGDYKDSAANAQTAYDALYAAPAQATAAPTPKAAATPKPQASGFSGAQVGDIITFGAYEQDNNKSNGKEPIKWRVLDKENDRLLVISQYGLDCRQFHKSSRNRWKTCDLHKWLNKEFINAAFSPAELRQIPTVSLFTPTTHNSTEGDTTQDRVFLLSTQEAERYFRSDADRICKATAYTKKQGATTVDGDICWWWLRSPGISEYSTVKVFTTGKIDNSGYNPNSLRGSVRPALWIELEP